MQNLVSMTFFDSIEQLEEVFLDLLCIKRLATVVEQLLQVLIEVLEDESELTISV